MSNMTNSAIEHGTLVSAICEVLRGGDSAPFRCLQMSAALYIILRDRHNAAAQLVTGDLLFGSDFLFKQDFSVVGAHTESLKNWRGHAWVEIDNRICDLSLYGTLYTDEFDRPFKQELVRKLGKRRGALVGKHKAIRERRGLLYRGIDQLNDDTVRELLDGGASLPVSSTL